MGGGVIRTAAKAAALGGYRSAVGRTGVRPSSASVVPAGDSGLSVALVSSSETGRAEAPEIHRPPVMRDFDDWDWEFAGVEEEELFGAIHPTPRIVFGSVPTSKEAKEATSDLKDAIEKVYFSDNSTKESAKSSQGSSFSENSVVVPTIPKHVAHAFSLLQGNPEAQNVVASLACDKNVWDAIMKNEKVMKFCNNHESTALPPERCAEESAEEESLEGVPPEETSKGSEIWDWVNDFKARVSEMVSNISDLLQDFMGTSAGTTSRTKVSTAESYAVPVGASFLALAVAAILVVLLKRGA